MSKKKINVVELNKKQERIVLEEKQFPILLFLRSHNLLLLLTALILSLTILSIGIIATFKNISKNEKAIIKNASIDTNLDNYIANVTLDDNAMTDDSAKDAFLKEHTFKTSGEVVLTKIIDNEKFTIKYYSDGTSLRIAKSIGSITRINALTDGRYGISDDGIINSKAITSTVTIKETKKYDWGKVTYYSDGSAEVSNSDIEVFVRDSADINDKYISNNKVSYLQNTKKIGENILNYYYDGTIEVIKNNKRYLVRNESDLNISNNDVTFNNENAAEVYKSQTMADGIIIDYYQDGGAIIHNGDKTISVRKSNSITIKDNKLYEIADNTYVEISNTKSGVTYYTNGGAIIDNNNKKYYVPENSDIKYQNNAISSIPSNKETLSSETNIDDENVKIFEKNAVVTTKDYINIIPKEKVVYDDSGKIKKIEVKTDEKRKEFKITNNTNEKINYRIVIEKSNKTTLDTEYIKFQLKANNNYIDPTKLSDTIWGKDKLYEALKLNGTQYILIDDTIEAYDEENISIMFWTDYDTIPNTMQNKYFYGTIKLYAWGEK